MYRVNLLATIIMALYAGTVNNTSTAATVNCCSSTYINNSTAIKDQYSGSFQCYNDKCNKAIQQFIETANLMLEKKLPTIVNINTFKFNPKVSLVHMIANALF